MDLLRIAMRIARFPWETEAPKNKNGMTWEEWCKATGRDPKETSYQVAWKQGEDPKKFMATVAASDAGFDPKALRITGEDPGDDIGPDGESNSRTIHGTYEGHAFTYFVEQAERDRSKLVRDELVRESTEDFFFDPAHKDVVDGLTGHLLDLVFA